MEEWRLEDLLNAEALATVRTPISRRVKRQRFLAGPIPMKWLAEARKLGVSALWVSVLLWHQRGMRKQTCFSLSNLACEEWGVSADAKCRALRKLEVAGLIALEWSGKQSPTVTLLQVG